MAQVKTTRGKAGAQPSGSPGDSRRRSDREERPGTGALCPEAQADGVPCSQLDRDCEVCEHADADPGGEKSTR
jgi:hypothetical protein